MTRLEGPWILAFGHDMPVRAVNTGSPGRQVCERLSIGLTG